MNPSGVVAESVSGDDALFNTRLMSRFSVTAPPMLASADATNWRESVSPALRIPMLAWLWMKFVPLADCAENTGIPANSDRALEATVPLYPLATNAEAGIKVNAAPLRL